MRYEPLTHLAAIEGFLDEAAEAIAKAKAQLLASRVEDPAPVTLPTCARCPEPESEHWFEEDQWRPHKYEPKGVR